jgi:hypothetical protein
MTDLALYQRDEELRRRLNTFLRETFDLPDVDYYGRFDLKELLSLKSVLSDINNALTVRLTLGFIDWIGRTLALDESAVSEVRRDVLTAKPSSNGHDVHCNGSPSFIAEVKCNVPINGGRIYGSAQKNGIINDIEALLHGKSKAALAAPGTLKFMVFLDLPEVKAANDHLKSSNSRIAKEFVILRPQEKPVDHNVVYGVHVPLGA